MNFLELIKRASPSPEPLFTGKWATLIFRPDLGSQQEFIVGVIASINGDTSPQIKWLPSLSRLSALYGEALTTTEITALLSGSEQAIRFSYASTLEKIDSGTPHVSVRPCGYMATHNIDLELISLLKRQSGAIWQEPQAREQTMDDDWAYSVMLNAVSAIQSQSNLWIPHRTLTLQNKTLSVALDSGKSYANIISARYSSYQTVERHIYTSMLQVSTAHRLSSRSSPPALFVVLPDAKTSEEALTSKKTANLLREVEDSGLMQFCEPSPADLALKLGAWASL
ncbi:hypothetical protein O0882_12750 [Janthinobacterium sp. SUN073]|uniref:hypothetical protein n=1 Tax=Janthinobacterium sp. SUN073 TaxID=3004102 RepID=UPI0025AF9441|nr:hypothetical protein [Janthinobacterium sp. SUN073]MDN2697185.1 hypothetical protein [Janthinobacterium sp. SUN073]